MDPTILLAIDERTVDRVARTGGELANALGARLVLAHVRGGGRSFNSSSGHEILDRAHDALPAGVEPERVEVGTPAHRLAELASEVGAALIVAGTRGRGRLASALRGSVSQTLVRRASCPVLIVSDRAPVTDPASAWLCHGRALHDRRRSGRLAGVARRRCLREGTRPGPR